MDFFSLPGIFVFSPGVTGLTPPPPTPSRFQATRFEGFDAGLISPLPCWLWYVLKRALLRCIPKPGLEWSGRLSNRGIELILIHDSSFIILACGKMREERMRLLIINACDHGYINQYGTIFLSKYFLIPTLVPIEMSLKYYGQLKKSIISTNFWSRDTKVLISF